MMVAAVFAVPVMAAATGFSAEKVHAFSIWGEEEWTRQTRVVDADLVDQLKGMFDGASTATAPVAYTELATLQLESTEAVSEDTAADTAAIYKAVRQESTGNVFLLHGNRTAKIDPQEFYALASNVAGFYQYRPIPAATVSGETAAVTASTYSFKKMDGIFYYSLYQAGGVPAVAAGSDGILLPTFSIEPQSATVKVTQDREVVFQGTLIQAKVYSGVANGLVEIEATYESDYYKGTVTYQYHVGARNSGAVQFNVDGSETFQGEVIVLRATGVPAGETVTVQTDVGFTPKFYDDGKGGQIALLPLSYNNSAGSYYVQLSAAGTTERYSITANNKTFQIQNLTMPESTAQATIESQKANDEFNEKFLPLRWDDDAVQHWEGQFMLPVQGARVTTEFGCIRYTNGSSESSRHGGVDLACSTGTAIYAPNNGRVVYAGYLQLTGYTIMIEHGYGLKTWYYHMNSVNVKVGDMVTKGQKIGEVGSTGYSTGPHLHYAMAVNNVYINPYTLTDTDLLAK